MSGAYNPNLVVVTIGGVPVGSLQKDVFVDVAYAEPAVTLRETVQGEGVFSVKRSNSATVTLKCEPNSAANALLSSYFEAQRGPSGGGAFTFAIIDNNVPSGASIFASPYARVAQMPNQGWGDEAQAIEWSILCSDTTHRIGALPSGSALPV